MQLESHFTKIKHFLNPFEKLWSQEVINTYPNSLEAYEQDWINDLESLGLEQLWEIDCRFKTNSLKAGELKSLLDTMRLLEVVPTTKKSYPHKLPSWATYNIKGKKLHEIERLLPLIQELKAEKTLHKAIDIGGGVGHLARIMAHYHAIETSSLDSNQELQNLGKKRASKYPKPESSSPLHFIHHQFGPSSCEHPEVKKLFNHLCISLGLHTCGGLALNHIDMFLQHTNPSMINFGCCYSKLSHSEVNISQLAKQNPLSINEYALSLATRGHNQISYQDFLFKKQVKTQRYLLHLLMMEEYHQQRFTSVGQAKASIYWGDFSDYARNKLQEHGHQVKLTDAQLNSFAQKNTPLVERLFLANIIRWQFGRCIELYLLLDRCLYLIERGARQVQLHEIFDAELSPRNIAIMANK